VLEDVLAEAGLNDTASGRSRFVQRVEKRQSEELLIDSRETSESLKILRRGWIIGGEGFRDRMMDRIERLLEKKRGGQIKRTDRQRDWRKELSRPGWVTLD
jgi:hypothetical protein